MGPLAPPTRASLTEIFGFWQPVVPGSLGTVGTVQSPAATSRSLASYAVCHVGVGVGVRVEDLDPAPAPVSVRLAEPEEQADTKNVDAATTAIASG